jgi:hypothetical protein
VQSLNALLFSLPGEPFVSSYAKTVTVQVLCDCTAPMIEERDLFF